MLAKLPSIVAELRSRILTDLKNDDRRGKVISAPSK